MAQYNILIVDDEVSTLNSLERTLKGEYNVFSATSGEDALSIMEQKKMDLIIADYRMPGMSGIEFLERILQDYPNAIRIVLTAYASEELLVDAVNRIHAHGFLSKPWEPDEVKSIIRRLRFEREQAEARLRGSEEKYRLLIENAGVAISAVNNDGVLLFLNDIAAAELGGEADDFIGKSLHDVLPQNLADEYLTRIHRIMESGIGRTSEDMMELPSGVRWFSSNAQPVIDKSSNTSYLQVICQDITKQKKAETKLLWSEKLASIGRLSANLAHELNNPIDGILRYMKMLLSQMSQDDPKRVYAEQAQNGLLRLANMVRGLLDFAKTSKPVLDTIDIRQCISQVLSSLSSQISMRNIKVGTEFGENIPVNLYEDLELVFTNIMKNAIQAMPNGGKLSVNARMLSQRLFEVKFSDTGIGIPDEIRERIFEPFFTTKELGQGVGLGLSISQEIAKRYDGSIDVESEPDRGTTFTLRLPINKGRILVMDDEKYMRDLTSDMLSSLGYKVITAIDGTEAITLYKEAKDSGHPYSAVILDMVVPGGKGAVEAIKGLLEIDSEIKAIVSSGYSGNKIMAGFEEHGFKAAITKPYKISQLDELLHEVITGVQGTSKVHR